MLDFRQFINQTLRLPLGRYKNMVGSLVLGVSIVMAARPEQREIVPFPVRQAATIMATGDSRHPHTDTLQQELQQKKLTKLLKKSK